MAKKILIIRLGAIGDVVHSTIIQQSIKEKHPDTEIHFLTSEFISPLLENDPNLEKVWKFNNKKKDDFFYLLYLGIQLRKENFDIVINLSNSLRNKFLMFISNPKKFAKRNPHRVHAVDAFFNTAKDIFETVEKPKTLYLHLSKESEEFINNKLKNYPRPFITINPGGENDNLRQGRIWPLEYWGELSNKLIQNYGGTVFITGSKGEKSYHEKLPEIKSSITFSGELTLEQSAALFKQANLFISGDSGPLHMAASLNVKTLGLMGSTASHASGPYGEDGYSITADFECLACGQKICNKLQEGIYTPCMQALSPEDVFNFIEQNNLLK